MFTTMEPINVTADNIKYENSVPQYNPAYYTPFSEWNQPQHYYGQAWPQQPNIHVNYIMNSNVIHNYGAATAASNTGTSIQPTTNVSILKNYITFGDSLWWMIIQNGR